MDQCSSSGGLGRLRRLRRGGNGAEQTHSPQPTQDLTVFAYSTNADEPSVPSLQPDLTTSVPSVTCPSLDSEIASRGGRLSRLVRGGVAPNRSKSPSADSMLQTSMRGGGHIDARSKVDGCARGNFGEDPRDSLRVVPEQRASNFVSSEARPTRSGDRRRFLASEDEDSEIGKETDSKQVDRGSAVPACICGQPENDLMIGCDGPGCPIEWFHLACTGLSDVPEGDWFCARCSTRRETHKLQAHEKDVGEGVERPAVVSRRRRVGGRAAKLRDDSSESCGIDATCGRKRSRVGAGLQNRRRGSLVGMEEEGNLSSKSRKVSRKRVPRDGRVGRGEDVSRRESVATGANAAEKAEEEECVDSGGVRPFADLADSGAESSQGEGVARGAAQQDVGSRDPFDDLANSDAEEASERSRSCDSGDQLICRASGRGRRRLRERYCADADVVGLGGDVDEEISEWKKDLWARVPPGRKLDFAFSREACGASQIRRLSAECFVGGQPMFGADLRVNLHFLVGAVAYFRRAPEATRSGVAARHVGWLGRQALELGVVEKFELSRGRLVSQRAEKCDEGKRRVMIEDDCEAVLLGVGHEDVRFPSRRDMEEDETERVAKRKQAVQSLRTRHQERWSQFKPTSSTDFDVKKLRDSMNAPTLSFDWSAPDEDENEVKEADSGAMLEVEMPEGKKDSAGMRLLMKQSLQKNVSKRLIESLVGRENRTNYAAVDQTDKVDVGLDDSADSCKNTVDESGVNSGKCNADAQQGTHFDAASSVSAGRGTSLGDNRCIDESNGGERGRKKRRIACQQHVEDDVEANVVDEADSQHSSCSFSSVGIVPTPPLAAAKDIDASGQSPAVTPEKFRRHSSFSRSQSALADDVVACTGGDSTSITHSPATSANADTQVAAASIADAVGAVAATCVGGDGSNASIHTLLAGANDLNNASGLGETLGETSADGDLAATAVAAGQTKIGANVSLTEPCSDEVCSAVAAPTRASAEAPAVERGAKQPRFQSRISDMFRRASPSEHAPASSMHEVGTDGGAYAAGGKDQPIVLDTARGFHTSLEAAVTFPQTSSDKAEVIGARHNGNIGEAAMGQRAHVPEMFRRATSRHVAVTAAVASTANTVTATAKAPGSQTALARGREVEGCTRGKEVLASIPSPSGGSQTRDDFTTSEHIVRLSRLRRPCDKPACSVDVRSGIDCGPAGEGDSFASIQAALEEKHQDNGGEGSQEADAENEVVAKASGTEDEEDQEDERDGEDAQPVARDDSSDEEKLVVEDGNDAGPLGKEESSSSEEDFFAQEDASRADMRRRRLEAIEQTRQHRRRIRFEMIDAQQAGSETQRTLQLGLATMNEKEQARLRSIIGVEEELPTYGSAHDVGAASHSVASSTSNVAARDGSDVSRSQTVGGRRIRPGVNARPGFGNCFGGGLSQRNLGGAAKAEKPKRLLFATQGHLEDEDRMLYSTAARNGGGSGGSRGVMSFLSSARSSKKAAVSPAAAARASALAAVGRRSSRKTASDAYPNQT
eukprot:TRINITY_DN34306_c0_g1_i1.p1 TRINITY_DN34306_c0_g1~~TRINITY_DN34306_c0_g1_i1.p1  ORF type:complete len:1535 (-),score=317.01 TRINITY_DN34306_c0_g1_i1:164-4708(-)